jgi:hypothetical protein
MNPGLPVNGGPCFGVVEMTMNLFTQSNAENQGAAAAP